MAHLNFELFSSLLNPLGIEIEKVHDQNMSDVEMYKIKSFTEDQINRNHYDSRNGTPIKYLVTHYTVCNFLETLKLFTANIPEGRVSAHYVVTEKEDNLPSGVVFQLINENDRAWHAGISKWGEQPNLNASSIGIEIVNKGFIGNYTSPSCEWFPFDEEQMRVVGLLMQNIQQRHNILPMNIVGHSDIAPDRKQDPGILFEWSKIHEVYNVGAYLTSEEKTNQSEVVRIYNPQEPLPQGVSQPFMWSQLQKIGFPMKGAEGYFDEDNKKTLMAYRMHYSDNQHPEYNIARDLEAKDMHEPWALNAKYPKLTMN